MLRNFCNRKNRNGEGGLMMEYRGKRFDKKRNVYYFVKSYRINKYQEIKRKVQKHKRMKHGMNEIK